MGASRPCSSHLHWLRDALDVLLSETQTTALHSRFEKRKKSDAGLPKIQDLEFSGTIASRSVDTFQDRGFKATGQPKFCDPGSGNVVAILTSTCALSLFPEHQLTIIPVIKEIEAEERTQSRNERRREKQRKMAEEEEASARTTGEAAQSNPQAKAKPMFF